MDVRFRVVREDFERATLESLLIDNKSKRYDQKLRKDYANWAKKTVTLWLVFIVILLIWVGIYDYSAPKTSLFSESVLITLLATTTINVIALTLFIIKGLFESN